MDENVQGLCRHHVHVSSCQPHHHVQSQPLIIKELGRVTLRKRVNSQVKALSGAKPCVSSGKVHGCRDRRSRVSVSAGAARNGWVHFQKRRSANLHQTVARVRFRKKKSPKKTDGIGATGICAVESPLPALHGRCSIQRDTPAMRVCNRLWQNALAWLRAAKHEGPCCDAPGKRDCSWRFLNAS